MKKFTLMLLIGAPAVLSAMQIGQIEQQDKSTINARLREAVRQVAAESRHNIPNWPEVTAHAVGLASIRDQIYRDIPIDENQMLIEQFSKALAHLKKAFSKSAQNDPETVAAWLIRTINHVDQTVNNYAQATQIQKVQMAHRITVLTAAVDGALASLPPAEAQMAQDALHQLKSNYYGQVAQEYEAR